MRHQRGFVTSALALVMAFSAAAPSQGGAAELSQEEIKNRVALLASVERLRSGVPPSSSVTEISRSANQSAEALNKLRNQLAAESNSNDKNCARFVQLSDKVAEALLNGVTILSIAPARLEARSDPDFELVNRFQILIFAYAELEFLLKSQAEAGYGVLDWNSRTKCSFTDRAALTAAFQKTLEQLTVFFNLAFGSPGLEKSEEVLTRLLELSVADEPKDRKRFWGVMAVGTVASVALWEFAPAGAALGVRLIWGSTPRILVIPAFLYGTKVSALIAEGAAFSYATDLTSSKIIPPKIIAGSWDEHLSTIEVLLESPVHSPELELILMSRVQAIIFSENAVLLTGMRPLLEAEEKQWGTLAGAIAHYRQLITAGKE